MRPLKCILISGIFLISLALVNGQTDKKGSGVVNLNMSKKPEEKPADKPNVSSATFQLKKPVEQESRNVSSTSFQVSKPETTPQVSNTSPGSLVTSRIAWQSPSLNSINTSQGNYTIKAAVIAEENLQVVNIFINDIFLKNIIVKSGTGNRMDIEEEIELILGNNVVRIEGVGITGKKVSDKVFINYDLSNAKYYALIIAVEDYDDPKINDLSEPISDADKFYRVISSRYTFRQENITYLKNPTKAEIIGTLHNMRGIVSEEDNLLIYYAGHGYWDEEMGTGYWLPKDAESDNPVNWLPNTDLTNYLNVLKTKHTLLIADACFSGGIFKTRSAFNSTGTVEKLYRLPSRKAMTSGTLTEVPDKSVFIDFLLRHLDGNGEKYLTSEQLFSQIRTPVLNNSDNIPQYGTIQKVGDEGGDFVFILK